MAANVTVYDRADVAVVAYHQSIRAHADALAALSLLRAMLWLTIAAACLDEIADCAAAIAADVDTQPVEA
jgi:hypothetical protein